MKIKLFNSFVIVVLVILISLLGCQKNSTAPDIDDQNSSLTLTLPGNYASASAQVTIKLTSNSDQQANDLFSPGTGSIPITGAHTTDLRHLTPVYLDDVGILLASDQSPLNSFIAPTYPLHNLMLIDLAGFIKMATFTAKSSAVDSINYFGRYSSFDYVDSTRTLNADDFNYYTQDSSAFVNFNGSLTAAVIDLPANIETTALFTTIPVVGIGFLSLNEDSTFQIKINYESITDSISGRWYLPMSNRIAFIHESDDGTAADTVEVGYEKTANGLSLQIDEDAGEYLALTGYSDLIPTLEIVLGMDENSLENINVELNILLAGQVGKPLILFSAPFNPESLQPHNVLDNLAAMGKRVKDLSISLKN